MASNVSRQPKRGGFTLIELLVVIAIVMLLASFLVAGLWPQKEKALRSNTMAMLEAVKTALDQYYSEFHDYPPDGYDAEPGWAVSSPGVKLGKLQLPYYGSGCLIYFLCYPINNVTIVGADPSDPRNQRVTPCNKGSAFLTTLKRENFSSWWVDNDFDVAVNPGMGGYTAAKRWNEGEIVDAFGWPIHYDKVGDQADKVHFDKTRFSGDLGNLAHSDKRYMTDFVKPRLADESQRNFCPADDASHTAGGTGALKHADPRSPAESCGCFVDAPTKGSPVPRNPGNADLWSHGKSWANGISSITNWK